MTKTKGIALVAIVAIMLVGGTTFSLTPVASVQASDNGGDDQDDFKQSNHNSQSQSLPSGQKDNIVTSNENSENSAAKNTIDRDHDVKQASAAGERALDMERTIETPNKEIKIDVESDDNSQASASKGDSEDTVMANNGGDGGDSEDNDQDANGGDGGDSEDNDQDANGGDAQ
jgi:hypothetical protein